MHVKRCGSGNAILFIHGMPTSGRLWSSIIETLCPHFTCFAVDLPGFGRSRPEGLRISDLRALAGQLDEVRREHGIETWHLVGHDAGSVAAVHYAALYPERVRTLALMSPALFPELRPFYLIESLRCPVLGEVLAPLVHALFWRVAMRRSVPAAERAGGACREFKQPFAGPLGSWRFMKAARWGEPAKVLGEVPAMLATLNVPTIIFHGTQDTVVPSAFAHRAAALIPGASMVLLESGHFLPLHQPAALAGSLSRFFGQAVPVPSPHAI